MEHLNLAKKNKEVSPESWNSFREKLIVEKIRNGEKVNNTTTRAPISANEEYAIFRKTIKYILDKLQKLL